MCAAPTANTAPILEDESIKQHLVNVGSEDLTVKRSANVDSLDSTVKRSARIDSFLAIPSTGFSCSAQAEPGIYADQETGCQVISPGVTRCIYLLLTKFLLLLFSLFTN